MKSVWTRCTDTVSKRGFKSEHPEFEHLSICDACFSGFSKNTSRTRLSSSWETSKGLPQSADALSIRSPAPAFSRNNSNTFTRVIWSKRRFQLTDWQLDSLNHITHHSTYEAELFNPDLFWFISFKRKTNYRIKWCKLRFGWNEMTDHCDNLLIFSWSSLNQCCQINMTDLKSNVLRNQKKSFCG